MHQIRRILAFFLCMLVLSASVSGCKQQEITAEHQQLNIYTSFYPLYALTEMLIQDVADTNLYCLVQPQDGCLRNYQLSDWDLTLLMRSADMVIIGGRGLESFENTLYSLGENGPAIAAVLYNKELAPAVMESNSDETNHWQEQNPHLYMSPEGAILIAESIAAQLCVADPENTDSYMKNLDHTENKLWSIIDDLKQTSEYLTGEKAVLMTESALYTAMDCGLEVELCVAKESGEAYYDSELNKLINELSSCESRVILIEKQAPERFCEALQAAGFVLAKIDTMSTHRADEGSQAYLDALASNISAVQAAYQMN